MMSNEPETGNPITSSFDWSANPQEHHETNSDDEFRSTTELINLTDMKRVYRPYDSPK